MLTKEWEKLKNGSDIRGVAVAVPQGSEVNLTPERVRRIAGAFLLFLCRRTGKRPQELVLAVGRDSRISGPTLLRTAAETFCAAGARCHDMGLMTTPGMFMACVHQSLQCDGAVQITASHLPFERNGMKFFTPAGGLEGADITALLEDAMAGNTPAPAAGGVIVQTDFLSVYARGLAEGMRARIQDPVHPDRPLSGLHIVVDAGNGAGGFFAGQVLEALGADVSGSCFLEPDGMFPNHVPNPENETAMQAISEAVLRSGADFGVIFDTDVDRAAAVGRDGKEINRNRLIALISAILLREEPGAVIVTDSVTSDGLTEFIQAHGGVHRRFKRGYRNVINEAIRLNQNGVSCPLAIETSGHAALRENYFLDDGAYLMTVLIAELARARRQGKRLEDLLADLREPVESREFRIPITAEDFGAYGRNVLQELEHYAAEHGWQVVPNSFEGVRISFGPGEGNGWFLLRMSLHDPILPLNVESDETGGVRRILEHLRAFLQAFSKLDTSVLAAFCGAPENRI